MEMRRTPSTVPIGGRDAEMLIEDLCIALRNVALCDHALPSGQRVVERVQEVKSIHAELLNRGMSTQDRVKQLSVETGWQMTTLLEECLTFPMTIPYLRGATGIRSRFGCILCQKAEFPEGAEICLCSPCIASAIGAIEQRTHVSGMILYRTYTSWKRCAHADDDTVMMTVAWGEDDVFDNGHCKMCLEEERQRRSSVT